jgi:hypothetical protein
VSVTAPGKTRKASIGALLVAVGLLTGCSPIEYHGYDSGIDGTLWRQIASFEDPMNFNESSTREPWTYLAELGGDRWNGSASTLPDLGEGAIVVYDVSATESVAEFSVFISSGPRPDVLTDAGHEYSGPSQVYTCYGITADLGAEVLMVERAIFTECPAPLVNELPEDAAFASGDVFDG